ncbi:MAG: 3-hydroxyacyl-CoA dehydrogenase family protein [Planctomycetes bacterium]|nr:3-hydroxyacyl-CoA dehydrogenase family protein [Planctomycetota bacterium]
MSNKVPSTSETTVAVVGLGLLGRGIATCLLGNGFRVIGYDRSSESHAVARRYIEQGIGELIEHANFDPSLKQTWKDRYQEPQCFDDFQPCDFVIESIVEDAQIKQEVYEQIEKVIGPAVPIASNTSAIPITQLQKTCKHPERFLGMHWAEPAHATRFLELIRGPQTSDETVEVAVSLARRCGKDPVVLAKDSPGFIVNRLAYAMYREALQLVEEGVADVETIDRSFRNACGLWATMCGPFRWMDLTGGPALYAKAMKPVLPTLNNATELPETMRRLAENNAQGIRNGQVYDYTPEQAEQAEALFRKHAWNVRRLMDEYFPPEEL